MTKKVKMKKVDVKPIGKFDECPMCNDFRKATVPNDAYGKVCTGCNGKLQDVIKCLAKPRLPDKNELAAIYKRLSKYLNPYGELGTQSLDELMYVTIMDGDKDRVPFERMVPDNTSDKEVDSIQATKVAFVVNPFTMEHYFLIHDDQGQWLLHDRRLVTEIS